MKFSEILPALRRRLHFFWIARTRYDVHAPFLAGWVEAVVEDRRCYYAFSDIEVARSRWLEDPDPIQLNTLGAHSKVSDVKVRSAGDVLRSTAVGPETGRRLFRLALWLQPSSMLELGASLGISTAYLASADTRTPFISIEGQTAIARKASVHLNELGLHHVEVVTGRFEEQLPAALHRLGRLGLLFVDGDHRREAVWDNVMTCLPYRDDHSVFVIADIHWSDGMEAVWRDLRALPEVTLSVDVFHFGLLFFKKELLQKQHVAIVPAHWKPWRWGFFAAT